MQSSMVSRPKVAHRGPSWRRIWISWLFVFAFGAATCAQVTKSYHVHLPMDGRSLPYWHTRFGSDPFRRELHESLDLGYTWLTRNLKPTGFFVYSYDIAMGMERAGNNPIRQLMASRVLAEMSKSDPALVPLHRANLDSIVAQLYRETESGLGYVLFAGASKLGANAMALRTLVASPDFDRHSDTAARLALGIDSLLSNEGRFSAWFVEPAYEYDED